VFKYLVFRPENAKGPTNPVDFIDRRGERRSRNLFAASA
jgi:hypothetical protein